MKTSFTLLLLLLFGSAFHLSAQPGIGSVWHFGQGNALSFNTGEPLVVNGSQQFTFEGCASICASNGVLLFYTNGGGRSPLSGQSTGKIWNAFNEVVYDMGYEEGGGFSAAQSSVFIPKPGGGGRYYLFTMEEIEFNVGGPVPGQPQGRGLSWFELDATANGGAGALLAGPQSIYTPSYEALCAIKHTNNIDYWILINDASDGSLKTFNVSTAGIQPSGNYFPNQAGSYIKGSPDRRWIAMPASSGGLRLAQFDASTGIPQTPLLLNDVGSVNALEFSASGRYLFVVSEVTNGFQVGRYDLTSADIASSFELVSSNNLNLPAFVGQMQLAVNQRLYFLVQNPISTSCLLYEISCAESESPGVELAYVFPLTIFFGLPNFDNSIFYVAPDSIEASISPQPAYICENRPATLQASAAGAVSFIWSTGETTATITVNTPGDYSVTITDDCGRQATAQVAVGPGPSAGEAAPLVYYCAGDTARVRLADLLTGEDSIGVWREVSAVPSTGGAFDEANGVFVIDNQAPGLYTFRYSVPPLGPCLSDQALVRIRIGAAITGAEALVLPPSCNGAADGSIRIDAMLGGSPPFQYAFQNQAPDTIRAFTGLSPGSYQLSVQDQAGCSWDSIFTLLEPEALSLDISPDQTLFRGESATVSVQVTPANGAYTYLWSPDDQLSCNNCPSPIASPDQTTLYQVLVTNASGCTDSAQVQLNVIIPRRVFAPNAFSPNDDGVNDAFTLFSDEGVFEIESFEVFDRWGEQVFLRNNFQPNEVSLGWNGKFRGQLAPGGLYVFVAVVVFDDGASERYQGSFSLVR